MKPDPLPPPITPPKPPKGGYNDGTPPPPGKRLGSQGYALRIRNCHNPKGAAWRLCTILQPRSLEEAIRFTHPRSPVPTQIVDVLTDAYDDWTAAGKPPAR